MITARVAPTGLPVTILMPSEVTLKAAVPIVTVAMAEHTVKRLEPKANTIPAPIAGAANYAVRSWEFFFFIRCQLQFNNFFRYLFYLKLQERLYKYVFLRMRRLKMQRPAGLFVRRKVLHWRGQLLFGFRPNQDWHSVLDRNFSGSSREPPPI